MLAGLSGSRTTRSPLRGARMRSRGDGASRASGAGASSGLAAGGRGSRFAAAHAA